MKSILKTLILLCMAFLLVTLTTAAFAAETADVVVYVDAANGSENNDGLTEATAVKNIKTAYTKLSEAMAAKGLKSSASATGKIVFVTDYVFDTFTESAYSKDFGSGTHTYRVILEGKTAQVSLQFVPIKQSFVGMMGPTTIQNLNVRIADNAQNKYLSIHGRGGKLIIGEGVTTSDNADQRPILSAGPYFATSTSSNLEVNSGDWGAVYAGCYHKTLTGNATLVFNGGTTTQVSATYNNKVTGNVDITINGGTIGKVNIAASNNASVGGTATVKFNGGTITGTVGSTGTVGTILTNVTGNDVAFTYSGQVTLTGVTASKLFLGSNTRIIFSETVTGPVAVTVDKAVRYNVAYITAPSGTANSAFTFAQKAMTATVFGETKSWINTDESGFTGLVLKAPKEFTVKLYTSTKDGSQVTPDKTETINGIKYQYFANAMGNYRYVTSRTGYYTLTKVLWMSEEKSLTETVIDASSSKRDAIGWEPTTVKDYSDEAHANIVPEDESTLWWDDYSPLLVSPYFTDQTRAEHRATTQDEMESFIASLDDAKDNMYIYSLGTSPTYGFDIPIVIFTKVDLSGAKTLEEAAALIRADDKLVIHYQAQIHGNEPAGGEAALNMIARLDGQWGSDLLETINCYVIPRVNPDGSKNFTRNNGEGVNLNRDMLLATMPETAALRYACDLFLPDINIDGHEYTYQPENSSGSYADLMCSSGVNGNYSEEFIQLSETMARNHFQTFFDYGLQPSYYTNKANSYSPATNSGYHTTRGVLHFLMESRGIGGGNYTMTRRVVSHLIMAESVFEYAAAHHETITTLVDAERQRSIKLGETYEEDDVIYLQFKETLLEEYAHRSNKWNYVNGTLTSANDTIPIFYREPQDGKTRPRPTAYVFPGGESWTQDVLDVLEANGMKYYHLSGEKPLKLRQITGTISNGGLSAETYYSFPNGCYVVPMNQDRSILISYVFEPDICGYSADEGYGSLTQMGVIPSLDGCFPVYHYIHDLEADGTIETFTGAAAPTGLTGVSPEYAGESGKIMGLDASRSYAYRNSCSAEYTVVTGVTAIEGLSSGTWLVRYADSIGTPYKEVAIEITGGAVTGLVVFVDQANGLDSNDGLTEATPVATLSAAITVLGGNVTENSNAKVILLSDYSLGTKAFTFPSHSFTVTYTGKTSSVAFVKGGGTSQTDAAINLGGPSIFTNITLRNNTNADYNNFNCNGHKTVMAEGVTCVPNAKGKSFMLAAGCHSAACNSTELTVLSGSWNMIYAGGYTGAVKGDAKLTVKNATVAGQIMAGYSGSVSGSITYDISDVTTNGIYLGLAKTNSVAGVITATIGPNCTINYLYAGNRDSGNVKGTVHVIVDRADLSAATLYGTCKTSGTVAKSVLTNRGGKLGTVTGFTEVKQQPFTGVYHICQGGKVTETVYTFAEAATAASTLSNAVIQLGSDAVDTATVTGDFILDLNGYDLSGITVNGTIYGMDSTTDGYTCENIGTLTLASGTVVSNWKSTTEQLGTVHRYMTIADGSSYTFHRFYLAVTHQTLRPATDGVGYKAVFYGDSMVLANITGFGFNMQLGENTAKMVTTSAVESGKTVTLRIDNYDVVNHGETALYASAVLVLQDGTVIESTRCTMTLRAMLETLNLNYAQLSNAQLAAVAEFIKKYAISSTWKVENLI